MCEIKVKLNKHTHTHTHTCSTDEQKRVEVHIPDIHRESHRSGRVGEYDEADGKNKHTHTLLPTWEEGRNEAQIFSYTHTHTHTRMHMDCDFSNKSLSRGNMITLKHLLFCVFLAQEALLCLMSTVWDHCWTSNEGTLDFTKVLFSRVN